MSDTVSKGAVLAELDPVDEQRTLKKAEIALSASRARLLIAEKNLEIARRNMATSRKSRRRRCPST